MKYSNGNIIGRSFKHKDSREAFPIGYKIIGLTDKGVIKSINFYTNELSSWPSWANVEKVNEWVSAGLWIPMEKTNYLYEIY